MTHSAMTTRSFDLFPASCLATGVVLPMVVPVPCGYAFLASNHPHIVHIIQTAAAILRRRGYPVCVVLLPHSST